MVHQPVHPYQSTEGWVAYHREVAAAIPDHGVVLYVRSPLIGAAGFRALAEACPNVVGVKYAVPDPIALADLVRVLGDDRLVWSCGLAESWAPYFWLSGARGFPSGLATAAPEQSLALLPALRGGVHTAAMAIWPPLRPFEDIRALRQLAALAVEVGAEVALVRDGLVARVDVPLLDRAGDGVREHRRAGRLGPVVRPVAPVDDLEPAPGLRVLVLLDARGRLLQVGQDRAPARGARRRHVQHHDRGHGEPADRPAPRLGRVLGARHDPGLGARLVVGAVQDAAGALQGAGVDDQVVDRVVAGDPAVPDQVLVPRQERQRHEHAVRPQLVLPAGGVPQRA